MLSYMVPTVEEKPPPVPKNLQLELEDSAPLTNGHPKRIIKTQSKTSTISAESSASSLSSVLSEVPGTHNQTPSEKPKHKLITNGAAKHPTLKRVSFGSSKGSMVETLIYESPLQEEPELSPSADQASVDSNFGSDSSKASKVRVTFYECERPQIVSSPEPGELDDLDAPIAMSAPASDTHAYQRQASTDSGWDNPFRPDGDLSREADEIVEMINSGKPITPTPLNGDAPKLPESTENGQVHSPTKVSGLSATPKGANGTKAMSNGSDKPGQVELQRATVVQPGDASQVEHVNLKKKPKCKCCVIQ